jgi:sugar lactone lactonase YvrE
MKSSQVAGRFGSISTGSQNLFGTKIRGLPLALAICLGGLGPSGVLHAQNTYARPYVFTTLAGGAGGPGTADGSGSDAQFYYPFGVAVDSSGNVYVSDQYNHTIRKISSAGVVTTLAGSAGNPGSTEGTGTSARFNYPEGLAVDAAGNVYVADVVNSTVRKVTAAGVVTTFAGSAGSPGSADGTGTGAQFMYPHGVAVDGSGNVYVADTNSHTVRKITPGGTVTTLAGLAGSPGSADGTGSGAQFNRPDYLAVDGAGNLYVSDSDNFTIRKITPAGVVSTLAGNAGNSGSTDGAGSAARFYHPNGVAVDEAGNIFVVDTSNFTIRRITPAGAVTTLAGTPGVAGPADGVGSGIRFNFPYGLAADSAGNLYVADTLNNAIRKGHPAAVARDFNADGRADLLWSNTASGDRYFWLMTGTTVGASKFLGTVGTQWTVATGDFNADGQSDVFWSNTVNGDRYIWLVNGTTISASVFLATVAPAWTVATGDFNADGQSDLLWSNTATGDRYVWLMNGTKVSASLFLANVSPDWTASPGDFDGDGQTDLLWSNTINGDRYVWLMNGTTVSSNAFLGTVPPVWSVAN